MAFFSVLLVACRSQLVTTASSGRGFHEKAGRVNRKVHVLAE